MPQTMKDSVNLYIEFQHFSECAVSSQQSPQTFWPPIQILLRIYGYQFSIIQLIVGDRPSNLLLSSFEM